MDKLPNCPKCNSEYTYEDGNLLVCPECAYEWTAGSEAAGEEQEVIKDANGNVLNDGDTVTIIKDLKVKGASSALKQGTKVKNIRLLYGVTDGHDIDCKIDGFGAMKLKSSVVKKIQKKNRISRYGFFIVYLLFDEFYKIKSFKTMNGKYKHNYRINNPANADISKRDLNKELVSLNGKTYSQVWHEKIDELKEQGYSNSEAKTEARRWVSVVGYSEHQTGLAVDINADGVNSTGNQVYKWLEKNAWQYGFILRYPSDKEDVTGTAYEPWHYRYVGKNAAEEIYHQGICLEEYITELE